MRFPASLLLLSIALIPALPALAEDQAGISAAVRGEVALNRAQIAVGRQVVGGEPILLQDAIKSGQRSGMQILLLDQTVFTIGPESELVIDEFVYDPKTNAGKLGAEITKGVFRFVSGKIAHENPQDMNVKLPSGTLGVRGTMVAGRVDPATKSSRLVLLGEGPENDTGSPASAFEACNAGKCVRVSRPGYGTTIDGPDAPPVAPFLFSREEIDDLTQAVSDPQGWVETAGSGEGGTPDVAAGPGDEGSDQAGDPRSATDVSGRSDASGLALSDATRARLRRLDLLEQATGDAAQFTSQTVLVDGRPVVLPADCTSASSCLAGTLSPLQSFLPFDFTTYDQLTTLAASGLQQAVYQRSGLGLLSTLGQPDGSYDFSLQVFLGNRQATLDFFNINSSLLGISAASIQAITDFSTIPAGLNIPAGFVAATQLTGSAGGPCAAAASCSAVGVALLNNANGRIADSVLQDLVITAPVTGTTVTGTVTANPDVVIPRP